MQIVEFTPSTEAQNKAHFSANFRSNAFECPTREGRKKRNVGGYEYSWH